MYNGQASARPLTFLAQTFLPNQVMADTALEEAYFDQLPNKAAHAAADEQQPMYIISTLYRQTNKCICF